MRKNLICARKYLGLVAFRFQPSDMRLSACGDKIMMKSNNKLA